MRQHDRHLQEDTVGIAKRIGIEFAKALRAVAPLQQERLAIGHIGQPGLQCANFAGKDQRWIARQLSLNLLQRFAAPVFWHLNSRKIPPTGLFPACCHNLISLIVRSEPGPPCETP